MLYNNTLLKKNMVSGDSRRRRRIVKKKSYPNIDAPKFRGSVKSLVRVILNSEKVIKLPEIYDPDDETFAVTVKFNGLTTFSADFETYDPASSTFKLTPTEESQLGKHMIQIEMID